MEISELPLNEKTTIIAEKFMIAVLERKSQTTAVVSFVNLKNRKEVLKILQKTDGTKILQSLDTNYWKVYSAGEHINDFNMFHFKDLEIKVEVSTREKTLKLINFTNAKVAAE